MFRRLPESDAAAVAITIDGEPFAARAGDTVASALFAAGRLACRATPVSGTPRGPYCMMGVCFDCLVVVDGRANQQGCMLPVIDGMRIETQDGARDTGDPVRAGPALAPERDAKEPPQ